PLDALEFADAGGEAMTVLRAKRLLGDFATTTIAVTLAPWATAAPGLPADYGALITAFAERYCREHADAIVATSPLVARGIRRPVLLRPPLEPARDRAPALVGAAPMPEDDSRTVVRLGALRPGAGVETFLRAAEIVLSRAPDFRFVLRGDDTDTDPFGRSYLASLPDGPVEFGGPVRADLAGLPASGAQCVLPEGAAECPGTAPL